jgi:hypothetical protein
MSTLSDTASLVLKNLPKSSRLATVSGEVSSEIRHRMAAADREADWQRVHSYIADVLKDAHVLYAKLARLEGDFAGEELSRLERISESVLTLGEELSGFSKAFYEGKYSMAESDFTYGDEGNNSHPQKGQEPHGEAPSEDRFEAIFSEDEPSKSDDKEKDSSQNQEDFEQEQQSQQDQQ